MKLAKQLAIASIALGTGFGAIGCGVDLPKELRTKPSSGLTLAVKPKPLSENVHRGLKWLIQRQHGNGGWGPGHGDPKEVPDVANTCIAVQAFIRFGVTPGKGNYGHELLKAVDFICSSIEASDEESLFVTSVRSTQIQRKLGTYIDTFMSSMVLSEITGKMPSPKLNERVDQALGKVLAKMETHQQDDGSWKNEGWAPALAQSMAVKGINRAAQVGAAVPEEVRKRAENKSKRSFDKGSRRFDDRGSAGVELYATASTLSGIQDSVNTNKLRQKEIQKELKTAKKPGRKKILEEELMAMESTEDDLAKAQDVVVNRLDDEQFVAGFGTNGGEEFLSYLNIGESLILKGGEAWNKWDDKITANMNRTQDDDGAWKGKHCITGGTFCTSSALLVLMVDRTPVPISKQLARR